MSTCLITRDGLKLNDPNAARREKRSNDVCRRGKAQWSIPLPNKQKGAEQNLFDTKQRKHADDNERREFTHRRWGWMKDVLMCVFSSSSRLLTYAPVLHWFCYVMNCLWKHCPDDSVFNLLWMYSISLLLVVFAQKSWRAAGRWFLHGWKASDSDASATRTDGGGRSVSDHFLMERCQK